MQWARGMLKHFGKQSLHVSVAYGVIVIQNQNKGTVDLIQFINQAVSQC